MTGQNLKLGKFITEEVANVRWPSVISIPDLIYLWRKCYSWEKYISKTFGMSWCLPFYDGIFSGRKLFDLKIRKNRSSEYLRNIKCWKFYVPRISLGKWNMIPALNESLTFDLASLPIKQHCKSISCGFQ